MLTLAGYVDTEVAAIKTKTDFLPSATAGAAGGVLIAGSNAATTLATFTVTGAFTGNGETLATSGDIADDVWEEATGGHVSVGSFGFLVNGTNNGVIGLTSSVDALPTNSELTAALATVPASTPAMTVSGPPILTVPRSGSAVARYKIYTFNNAGALVDPTGNTVNVTCSDANGGTPPTVPATATRTAPGEYYVDVPIASTASKNQRLTLVATATVQSIGVIDSEGIQLMPLPPTSVTTE